MCHDLHVQFHSPTINLDFDDDEFIIFCQHLEYYLSLPVEPFESNEDFPMGVIRGKYGAVKIYFRHYKSFDEAVAKWYERTKRINWDNLFVIMEGGFATEQVLMDFEQLPFTNKVVYTDGEKSDIKHSIAVPKGFYSDNFFCGKLLQYTGKALRRNFEVLDYVKFINNGKIRKTIF